jgi:hypothetical protein
MLQRVGPQSWARAGSACPAQEIKRTVSSDDKTFLNENYCIEFRADLNLGRGSKHDRNEEKARKLTHGAVLYNHVISCSGNRMQPNGGAYHESTHYFFHLLVPVW